MKKIFFLLFILCSVFCYSQTWVERGEEMDFEFTVITREQYARLRSQYEERFSHVALEYIDVLESRPVNRVISGTKPNLSGYYYLLCKYTPRRDKMTQADINAWNLIQSTLVYGNSRTGRMYIDFGNSFFIIDYFGGFSLSKDYFSLFGEAPYNRYIRRYNQFIGYVNGE
jgi:hypothetical protein